MDASERRSRARSVSKPARYVDDVKEDPPMAKNKSIIEVREQGEHPTHLSPTPPSRMVSFVFRKFSAVLSYHSEKFFFTSVSLAGPLFSTTYAIRREETRRGV